VRAKRAPFRFWGEARSAERVVLCWGFNRGRLCWGTICLRSFEPEPEPMRTIIVRAGELLLPLIYEMIIQELRAGLGSLNQRIRK